MKIECTEGEKRIIEDIFEAMCPFQSGTILTCGEDSICSECMEDNIEFTIVEPECETPGGAE